MADSVGDQGETSSPASTCVQLDPMKFKVYETKTRLYLIGEIKQRNQRRILKIDRTTDPQEILVSEDPYVYSEVECAAALRAIDDGNRNHGGLRLVTKAYAIVGCIRFLKGMYLILVTQRKPLGSICGHMIYGIADTTVIPIQWDERWKKGCTSAAMLDYMIASTNLSTDPTSLDERRYCRLLALVELKKDFFYSHTYHVYASLQVNSLSKSDSAEDPYSNMFVWNEFLTRDMRSLLGTSAALWMVPIVHGFFEQRRLSVFGRAFNMTLISRRSRFFAGTRYLKRGVNDSGQVANDVETEQIIDINQDTTTGTPRLTSVVQNRGSIPLFWSQETSRFSPKPDIMLQKYDPLYQATFMHFRDLAERYGQPTIILNLIKAVEKHPREMILRREFANAVSYLNTQLDADEQLAYIHWDFSKHTKMRGVGVLAELEHIIGSALQLTDFFCLRPERPMSVEARCANIMDASDSSPSPWVCPLATSTTIGAGFTQTAAIERGSTCCLLGLQWGRGVMVGTI
ncbi:hypothetical protein CYMTET_33620 [Cymbomonas tetramitiformis]|uniref:SAC domain-containing protein n=1 Tax=Cymbomonas tetramitiformis TaxID=36881 RepID=A0AAE0FCJ9_9CHLO|nr:hypothetical protein CYMTET_33620 [Cymbomonas tetramitiformis]